MSSNFVEEIDIHVRLEQNFKKLPLLNRAHTMYCSNNSEFNLCFQYYTENRKRSSYIESRIGG